MSVHFDELRGIYRVNHPDGSFSTYSKKEYEQKFGDTDAPIEHELVDIIIDAQVVKPTIIQRIRNIIKI